MRHVLRNTCLAGCSGLLLSVVGSVTPAAAQPAVCGMVITQNFTLTSDVGPCNQGGLVVQGSGVTVDLGGHAVFGRPRQGDGAGILLDHVTGVTVKNGTVYAFDAGVEILGGGSNTVQGITARDNVGAFQNGKGQLGDGITIQTSNGNTVTSNNVYRNGPFSGISIVGDATNAAATGSSGNTISGNVVVDNSIASSPSGPNQDDGIRIEGPNATNTRMLGNRIQSNGLDGISVFADQGTGFRNSGSEIGGNTISGNGFHQFTHRKGDGIVLFGAPGSTTVGGADNSSVHDNHVTDNAANGIRVASKANTITTNVAQGNAAFPGVTNAFDLNDANTTCDANVWSNDTFTTRNQPCIF